MSFGTCDIAVVGGGPAGSICALLLARAGARVTLIDRPRYGVAPVELLSGRARRMLQTHLHKPLRHLMPVREIFETLSLWGTEEPASWSALQNPWGYGVSVNRDSFDALLLTAAQEAGVCVVRDSEVRCAEFQRDAWRLSLLSARGSKTDRADHLVLATGANAPILVDRAPAEEVSQFACMAHVNVSAPAEEHIFHLESARQGWWYGLPNPKGGRFVAFCSSAGAFSPRHIPSREAFVEMLSGTRLVGAGMTPGLGAIRMNGRPAGPRCHAQVAGANWIAVGDAAFVPDPLSGKGIEFAIESAQFAVEALCARNREAALNEYAQRIGNFAAEHKKQSALHRADANASVGAMNNVIETSV